MFERAYHDRLTIPEGYEGRLWRYAFDGVARRGHRHDELELNLVTHGTGELILRDRRYPLRRGALVWLFPAQDHILMQMPDFRMWVLEVEPALVARADRTGWAAPLLERDPGGRFCRFLDEERMAPLERLMEAVAPAGEPSLHSAGLAHVVLRAWELFRAAPEGDHAALHPAVAEAMRRLREAPAGEDGLEEIAAAVGLSASRLSRLFAAQLGTGFTAMRARVRLRRFLALVGDARGRNMLDAALAAGFGSYAQFFRVFRQEMGISPRLWAAGGTARLRP